jgi:hypothetical protein
VRDVAHDEWRQSLQQALGSFSSHFIEACLYRLLAACRVPGHGIPTSTGISAAMALIESLHPENEIQAAVAVHIACLDAAARNMLSRVSSHGMERRITMAANAAAKLERAFSAKINTYHRLKHGNQQVIRIEKVVVEAGAQAVVGQVVR